MSVFIAQNKTRHFISFKLSLLAIFQREGGKIASHIILNLLPPNGPVIHLEIDTNPRCVIVIPNQKVFDSD